MKNKSDYEQLLSELIKDKEFLSRIVILESQNGFAFSFVGKFYSIHVPDKKLGYLTELGFLHEVGHVLFHEHTRITKRKNEDGDIQYILGMDALKVMMTLSCVPGYFKKLQKWFYWNPVIKWFKRKLGVGGWVTYGPDDYYDAEKLFTREENELYCDWFAYTKGKPSKNVTLSKADWS